MQEENKKDNLIDVGEADESATEINLDEQQPKEEAAKEEKVEVAVSYTHLTLPTKRIV